MIDGNRHHIEQKFSSGPADLWNARASSFGFGQPVNQRTCTSKMNKALFVDDQPQVLLGLRRMLDGLWDEWDMVFATSGAEALQMMENDAFDVIVPEPIVAATAFHHGPERCKDPQFSPLTAVHVANALEQNWNSGDPIRAPELAMQYLEDLGFVDRLLVWREVCQSSEQESVSAQ